ncbi:DUF6491 family protein [Sphingosinicella terrae]|uniref:DUF6491 family protein n=1 Tax=Sphingosinicella terrae TaxID=2172047 RepID=UPI000E0D1ACB|nr:DUF6491 family protein [Sphingosinicella terrae]
MARPSFGAAAILLLTAGGCAAGSDDPGLGAQGASRQAPRCFSTRSVRNFRSADPTTVHLRVGPDVYRLDLMGACPDVDLTSRVRLATTGSAMVCTGSALGTSIVTRGPTGRPQRCQVRLVSALTPEEVAALPARVRP